MFRFIVASIAFTIYLILISVSRESGLPTAFKRSLYCFFCFVGVIALVFVCVLITNFAFFGDIFSPLEEQLDWIPILRAPLIEESSKFVMIYITKKKMQRISHKELIRLGGTIGNWFFLFENIGYAIRNPSLWVALFRLFPWHINYSFLDALAFKGNSSKKYWVFPTLAMFLHGFVNYLSLYHFSLYVVFGFAGSFTLFFIVLIITSMRSQLIYLS